MNELLTVEELAQMLDMHPKTVRRYIRDGQLKANKVGGEWRIRKEDFEMFLGGKFQQLKVETQQDVAAFIQGQDSEADGKYQVCTILDCYIDTEEAVQLSEMFTRHMNEPDPKRGKAKFQYFYLEEEQKSRYVIWGNPVFVGKMLSAAGEKIEQ